MAAIPAIGLLAGSAVGLLVPDVPRLILLVALVACSAASVWTWRVASWLVLAAVVATTFFLGGVLLSSDAWQRAWRPPLRAAFEALAAHEREEAAADGRPLPAEDEAFAIVEGVLRADASLGSNGVSLSLAIDRPASGGILVTVVGGLAAVRAGDWRAGRRVRLPVQLHRPARYLDPGVPDHERALARRGTTLVGTVKSGALVEVLARGSPIDEAMAAARSFARRAIAASVGRWSPQSAGIVTAIVIGDRAGLGDDVERSLQDAGTYHVIAISGGNIAILAGLLLAGFRIARWFGRGAMIAAIALLLAYARLVGGGASVDRATLMATVYFGARALDHRSAPLNALAVVAALLVAADPLSIADPGFVLTFGATLGILVVMPRVAVKSGKDAKEAKDAKDGKDDARHVVLVVGIARGALTMLSASAAAEAMLFPVGAAVFSRVTFAGLALNFLAIPLMGVAQVAGMCVVPLAAVSNHAALLAGWVAHVGAAGLVWSARLTRFAPALTFRVAAPAAWIVMLYYAALIIAWSASARQHVRAAATLAAVAALWILLDPAAIRASGGDGRLHVTFLDVGQGDSALVQFPRGSTLLVDAGGLAGSGFDIGDRVVAPVLRQAGVRRLDVLALTHGDPDHIGGAAAIVREFGPREVWEGIPVARSEPLAALRLEVQATGARWANVYAGDHVAIDGVEVTARHPVPADWERQKVRNDDSLVLELRWRDTSVLLTGDIGRAIEPAIAAATSPVRARIVKVPHHGSRTSSSEAFIHAIRPTIAVVSVGRNNHFGHPVPEVLERYRAAGAELFRTDKDGAVIVVTDGLTLSVHTFTGRVLTLDGTTKTQRHEDARRNVDAQNH